MRVLVRVERDAQRDPDQPDGWWVTLEGDVPAEQIGRRRFLRRLEGEGTMGDFPLPPEDADSSSDPLCELCNATEARVIWDPFVAIATRDPGRAVPRMGRYLFECLLGGGAWDEILALAGDDSVELALAWNGSETALTRLPWEMMRSRDAFLSQMLSPPVVITRRVRAAGDAPRRAAAIEGLVPRVLFAVGSDLRDKHIQSGTEYLGLLRQLKAGNLPLTSVPLLTASPNDIIKAVDRFEPSVLHLVCHGVVKDDASYVELRSDAPDEESQLISAVQLRNLVCRPGHIPAIVVLNACHSGEQRVRDRVNEPMAVQLVQGGVPMVIGMWGRVADRICRLFTRRFYTALLEGTPIVEAAAQGRREGFEQGEDPELTADWAFPSIFLAEHVDATVTADRNVLEQMQSLALRAGEYRKLDKPRMFCGRLDLLDGAFRQVIGLRVARNAGEGPSPGPVKTVLAIEEQEAPPDLKYGKTRLLMELAAEAASTGHVPCLVIMRATDETPSTATDLANMLVAAMDETRQRFELPYRGFEVRRLEDHLKHGAPKDDLHATTLQALDTVGSAAALDPQQHVHPRLLAAAIARDFIALGDDGRERPLHGRGRSVLLIDEAHRYGEGALSLLLDHLLDAPGLGKRGDIVPVVFASATGALGQEHGQAGRMLTEFFAAGAGQHVEKVTLTKWPSPFQDPLPYQQFLLGQDVPLILREDIGPEHRDGFLRMIDQYVRGAPSELLSVGVTATVQSFTVTEVLVPANDEDILEATGT